MSRMGHRTLSLRLRILEKAFLCIAVQSIAATLRKYSVDKLHTFALIPLSFFFVLSVNGGVHKQVISVSFLIQADEDLWLPETT